MYASHFGLREQPFNNTHDARYFYSTQDHEAALASLIYTVGELKGFTLLTGESGTGKTLVSRLMLAHFGERITFAELGGGHLEAGDLLRAIGTEFALDVRPENDDAKIAAALQEFLIDQFAANTPAVLVLDDAHLLPLATLQQLRSIAGIDAQDTRLLQIILLGQPELASVLSHPAMKPLRQRCFRSWRLTPLDRRQTEGYIRHRLAIAGATDASPFNSDSLDAIHELSRGVPRIINTLCDNVLLSAFSAGASLIDSALIRKVAVQTMALHDAQILYDGSISPNDAFDAFPGRATPGLAAPPSHAPSRDDHDGVTAHRIDQLERKIADLTVTPVQARVSGLDRLELTVTSQLASLGQRVEAIAQQSAAAPVVDRQERLAERLTAMEWQLNQLRHRQKHSEQHVVEQAKNADARMELRLAESRKLAEQAILRIQKHANTIEDIAASLRHDVDPAIENEDAADSDDPATLRKARVRSRRLMSLQASRLIVGRVVGPESRVQRLREKSDAAFARSRAAAGLVHSLNGLTQLASRVNMPPDDDAGDDMVAS